MDESGNKENFRICIKCKTKIKTGKRRWVCDACKYKLNLQRKKERYDALRKKQADIKEYYINSIPLEKKIMEEVFIFLYQKKWYWKHTKSKLISAQGFESYNKCKEDAIRAFS